MDTQWNIESSTETVQDWSNTENPVEVVTDNGLKSQSTSVIGDGKKGPLPRTFGPSRPVSLQPARKGGRKGPLHY